MLYTTLYNSLFVLFILQRGEGKKQRVESRINTYDEPLARPYA
jgi:hypothetical protein